MGSSNEVLINGIIRNIQKLQGSSSIQNDSSGSVSQEYTLSGSTSLPTDNNGATVVGAINNIRTLKGSTSLPSNSGGSITPTYSIFGNTSIPKVIGTAEDILHSDTTEGWNSNINTIAEKGHLYVYTDHHKVDNGDGTFTDVPAMKVGDGTSYLIDMPFISTDDYDLLMDHINNWQIHVSENDRTRWDQNLSAQVNESRECLIFSNI